MKLEQGWQRRVVIWWSLISGLVHVVWELSWCLAARFITAPAALHDWRLVWTLYGTADFRYLHADPFILTLESITGLVASTLNFWVAYHVWCRRRLAGAMVALLVVSVMEVYGTLLYFGTELFNHFGNVATHSFVRAWLMFFGLNALWLLFPGWCLYELTRYFAGALEVGGASVNARAPAAPPATTLSAHRSPGAAAPVLR